MATPNSWNPRRETPFVGRDLELDGLSSILRRVIRGRSRVAVVSGESGVGKSRLVREFAAIARRLDVHVAQGRAIEDSSVPYLPLMAILRSRAPVALASLTDGSDSTAFSLGPARAAARSASAVRDAGQNSEYERLRIFVAVTQEIVALARQQPTLIVIDDLHWADASSLDLLVHLIFAAADAAESEKLPLMLLLAHRPVAVEHRLSRLIERVRLESLSDTFLLEGLGSADTAAVVHALEPAPASNQLIQAVQAATQGYPLFIQEFVDQLRSEGRLVQAAGYTTLRSPPVESPSPHDVIDAFSARLNAFNVEDRRILAIAALLGDSFSADRLARVSGIDASELGQTLACARDQQVLVADQAGFRFRHPLLRGALASSMNASQRQAVHVQIAAALSRETSSPEATPAMSVEIANHLLAAGPYADPAQVVECARRGGDHAFSVFAWAEAARLYACAADAAAASGIVRGSALGQLHFLAGLAHQHDFDSGPCVVRYEHAMQAFRDSRDFAGEAQTLRHLTRVRYVTSWTTNYGEAIDLEPHEKVLAALGEGSPLVRGLLLEVMSQVCWTNRDSARAEALARRALDLGDSLGDDSLRYYASFALGLAQFQSGRLDEASASFAHSLDCSRRAGDPWTQSRPLQRLAVIAQARGDLEGAEQLFNEARELTGRVGYAAEASYAFANLAAIAAMRGAFRQADALAREGMTLMRRARYPWAGIIALAALVSARSQEGQFRDARHALHLMRTPGELFEDPGPLLHFVVAMNEDLIRLIEGAPDNAVDEIRARVGRLASLLAAGPFDATLAASLCTVVEIAARIGAPEAARVAHEHLVRLFQLGMVLTNGAIFSIPRVLALGSSLLGDAQAASHYFRVAEESTHTSGARPEHGRALLDHAEFLLKRNATSDRSGAVDRLRRAHAIFDELGMRPFAARAAQLAQHCDLLIPSRAPRPEPSELEARELELLQRIARGRTPGDIAREQLRDPESVAAEIERLFSKIDVSGPALAAAYAFGHGLVAPDSAQAPGPLVLMVTDMVGFTSFVERVGDTRAQTTIHVHNRAIRFQLARHGGREVTHTGDGMMASFPSGDDAVACAIAIQRQLKRHSEQHPDAPIRVRIGLNAGRVLPEEDRLFGAALNATVRVCQYAAAAQILVSASVLSFLREETTGSLREVGTFLLKGLANPIIIYELPWSV